MLQKTRTTSYQYNSLHVLLAFSLGAIFALSLDKLLWPHSSSSMMMMTSSSAMSVRQQQGLARRRAAAADDDERDALVPPQPPTTTAVATGAAAQSTAITVASDEPAASTARVIDVPDDVRRILINVGPNYTPLLPSHDDTSEVVFAIEASLRVAADLAARKLERVHVIGAAVSDAAGIAPFYSFNRGGISSSLFVANASVPTFVRWVWVDEAKGQQRVSFVPTVTLRHVLDCIPARIALPFLKTDMQGADFQALRSAGSALKRVAVVKAEVFGDVASYLNTSNNFAKDFVPLMEQQLGFVRVQGQQPGPPKKTGGLPEGDGCWYQPELAKSMGVNSMDDAKEWCKK